MSNLYKKPQIIGKSHWLDTAIYDKNGRITYIDDFYVCQVYKYMLNGKLRIIESYSKVDGLLIKRGVF